MDISKIISDSIGIAAKDIANGTHKNEIITDDENLNELISQNRLLMNYSNILLENYHEELKRVLAKQGIKI